MSRHDAAVMINARCDTVTLLPGLQSAWNVLIAFTITALPICFHLAGVPAGVAACTALGLMLTHFAAPTVPITLICAYLFQNLFVAIVSPQLTDVSSFNSARAYNFVLTVTIWFALMASFWMDRSQYDGRLKWILDITTAVLILIGVYFVIGLLSNPSSAITYLRNISCPVLLFQIFVLIFSSYRVTLTTPLVVVGLAAVIFGYLE